MEPDKRSPRTGKAALRWLLVCPAGVLGAWVFQVLAWFLELVWRVAGPPFQPDRFWQETFIFHCLNAFGCPLLFVLCGALTAPRPWKRPAAIALVLLWGAYSVFRYSRVELVSGSSGWEWPVKLSCVLSALGALAGLWAVRPVVAMWDGGPFFGPPEEAG